MDHWQDDMFRLKWNGLQAIAIVTFTLNPQDKVSEIKVKDFDDFKRVR